MDAFVRDIDALARRARARVGPSDVALLRTLKAVSRGSELFGRLALHLSAGPLSWCAGVTSLVLHLGLEAQLNHSIQHGAYEGLDPAFARERYETLALPLQTRTWRDAHRTHHANPSLVGLDPDTVHPLFRVHADDPWRPWHLLNGLLGTVFVFECWGRDYDRFLKQSGARPLSDGSELRKLLLFGAYQLVLFPLLAGPQWAQVFVGTLVAIVLRNFIYVFLQTASSVGTSVSTLHARSTGRKKRDAWLRFQIESSKNYAAPAAWTLLSGGLDRHIEHHLFPKLPPSRLRALGPEVRAICERHGVRYEEHRTPWASFADSVRHLARLAAQR